MQLSDISLEAIDLEKDVEILYPSSSSQKSDIKKTRRAYSLPSSVERRIASAAICAKKKMKSTKSFF